MGHPDLENEPNYETESETEHEYEAEPVPEPEPEPETDTQLELDPRIATPLILDDFTISEIIYNTGTKNFNLEDKEFWITQPPDDFFSKYIDNPENEVIRSSNVLEMYYNGTEFVGNSKRTYFADDENYGYIKMSRTNLYSKETDEKIGVAQFVCTSNIFGNKGYVSCESTYFIETDMVPQNIKAVASFLPKFSSINFRDNYISRGTSGSTFWEEGDAFFSEADYFLENGLNRTTASVNIYLPKNSEERRRSICINFDTLKSNNFLPQEEYGSDTLKGIKIKEKISDTTKILNNSIERAQEIIENNTPSLPKKSLL